MIYILVTFIALILFDNYLFTNIINIGDSAGIWKLLLVLLLLIGLTIRRIIVLKRNCIRKSFVILLLFFLYVAFKIIVDLDLLSIKTYMIGTDSGILSFYFLAVLISISFDKINTLTVTSKRCFMLFLFLSGVYLLFNVYFLYKAYHDFSGFVSNSSGRVILFRSDIEIDNLYQRAGRFLSISSLLLSFIYVNLLLSIRKRNFLYTFLLIIYTCTLFGTFLFSMLLAQIIGSNNALFCNGFLFLINSIFLIFLLLPKAKFTLKNDILNFKNVISGWIAKRLVISIFIGSICFIGFLNFAINKSNIDTDTLRVTNRGAGRISSVDSRLNLLPMYATHLSYSPITPFFGNMQVDVLTTGKGTHVHSFLGTILTHLGIIGLVLFLRFIFYAFKELFDKSIGLYKNGMKIYKTFLFFSFLAIATAATPFWWNPMWFIIGLYFSPIGLHVSKNKMSIK